MHGAPEDVRFLPVKCDRAGWLPVGAKRQRQAAAEPGLSRGPAELGPAMLGRGVIDPARLVVAQRFHDWAVAALELKPVQLIQPAVGGGESQRALWHGDRYRRRGVAGDQFHCQAGQPAQRAIGNLFLDQQLSDLGDTVGEFPGNSHHRRVCYPAAPRSCAARRFNPAGLGKYLHGPAMHAGQALENGGAGPEVLSGAPRVAGAKLTVLDCGPGGSLGRRASTTSCVRVGHAGGRERKPALTRPLQYPVPSGQALTVVPSGGQPADIIELILADHRRIRRLCGALEDAVRQSSDPGHGWMLAPAWERLAGLLEEHTRAEDEICRLPMFRCLPRASGSRREAIGDHDDIREAISEASLQPAASVPWRRAVRAVVTTSTNHIDWEEREVLAQSRLRLTLARRRELGRQWSACIAAWRLDAMP